MFVIKLIFLAIGFATGGILAYGAWSFNRDGTRKPVTGRAPGKPQRSVSLSSIRRLRARASSVSAGSSG